MRLLDKLDQSLGSVLECRSHFPSQSKSLGTGYPLASMNGMMSWANRRSGRDLI